MIALLRFACFFFFFQAEDGIRDYKVTGVQTCALPICLPPPHGFFLHDAGVWISALFPAIFILGSLPPPHGFFLHDAGVWISALFPAIFILGSLPPPHGF